MSEGRSVLVGPILDFVVLGKPEQQGSVKGWGGGRYSDTNAKDLRPWRADVSAAAQVAITGASGKDGDGGGVPAGDAEPSFPLAGPVSVVCEFTVRKPTSYPKTRTTWPVARPDLDKLVRAILDALSAAGVYKDDSQVVGITTSKTFPNQDRWSLHVPGVRIKVYRLTWMEEGEG